MKYKGSCHCKNIEFEVETNLEKIAQCVFEEMQK